MIRASCREEEIRVQSTDEITEGRGAVSLQVDVVICHLYSAVSDNTKDNIVDVSDTACRVPTSALHRSPFRFHISPFTL